MMRYFLNKENKRRDALGHDYIEKYYDEDGDEIDPTFLDVTDVSNLP